MYIMKAFLVSSIVALSIANGAIFFTANNPTEVIAYSAIPEVVAETTVVETAIIETIVEPVAETPAESTVEVIVEPIVEQKAPTFEDMQLKYMKIRNSTDLHMFFVTIATIYPDKFTPENIEASFAFINNLFDNTKPDWTNRTFGDSTVRTDLLAGTYVW